MHLKICPMESPQNVTLSCTTCWWKVNYTFLAVMVQVVPQFMQCFTDVPGLYTCTRYCSFSWTLMFSGFFPKSFKYNSGFAFNPTALVLNLLVISQPVSWWTAGRTLHTDSPTLWVRMYTGRYLVLFATAALIHNSCNQRALSVAQKCDRSTTTSLWLESTIIPVAPPATECNIWGISLTSTSSISMFKYGSVPLHCYGKWPCMVQPLYVQQCPIHSQPHEHQD